MPIIFVDNKPNNFNQNKEAMWTIDNLRDW